MQRKKYFINALDLYIIINKNSHTHDTHCFGFTEELQVKENCEAHVENR